MFAEIKTDQVPAVAAGLAFYAMLAAFPALIAFVSIYGLLARRTSSGSSPRWARSRPMPPP